MNQKTGTGKYEQLLIKCRDLECEASALSGALEAAEKGLIMPILVGPVAKIESVAKSAGISLGKTEIVDAPHSNESALKAVALVRGGAAIAYSTGFLDQKDFSIGGILIGLLGPTTVILWVTQSLENFILENKIRPVKE